jgi:transcriptional regulator with XRE-family HTH domain
MAAVPDATRPNAMSDCRPAECRLSSPSSRRRSPRRAAEDPDVHIGRRIRERRLMLGLSQQQLAAMIGVTYQQAHKYETGLNRVSAGRLFRIAEALQVPVSWFYEGLGAPRSATLSRRERLGLELARNFALIRDERQQEALSQMARALAEAALRAAE